MSTSHGFRPAALSRIGSIGPLPGRWVGGVSLILGPLVLLTGVLLRIRYNFFFPDQLAAYHDDPVLITASYSFFAAGIVVLFPGVVVLTTRIGERFPEFAAWAGTLTVLGLFARVFHAGVDHLAFQLVPSLGVAEATRTVAASYGAFHIFSTLNVAIMAGWVLLAVGAWRARVFGIVRALALACTAALPLGVLKGTTPLSVVAVTGLCIAFVPLGVAVLRGGAGAAGSPDDESKPAVRPLAVAFRILMVVAAGIIMYFVGRLG